MAFTNAEKLEAVSRELGYRRSVYKRRVEGGTMTREFANRQIALFEQIEDDYRKLTEGERLL